MEKKRLEQHRMKPDGEKGRRGQIETVDPETGEVLKGVFAFIPDRYRSPFGKDFFVMAQEALAYLAQNRRHLGEEGLAVFCCLASRLDFENFILINQAEAARELGMLPPNFSRAVKRLETLGILSKGPKTGKSATWRLNPQVAWKGTGKKHFGALREAQKRGWKLINGGELEQAQDEQQLDLFNDPAPAPADDAAPDRQ